MKIVETPAGFLLYSLPNLFHWLPNHGFTDEHARARFAELARSNAKEYKVV